MSKRKSGVLIIGPAWHSCGSYQLFKSQIATYQSLGFSTYFLAVSNSTSKGDNSKDFWNYYLNMTSDLPTKYRGNTSLKKHVSLGAARMAEFVRCLSKTFSYYRTIPARVVELPTSFSEFINSHEIELIHCNHYFNLPVAEKANELVRRSQSCSAKVICETHDIQSRHFIATNPSHPITGVAGDYESYFLDEIRCCSTADEFIHLNDEEFYSFKRAIPRKAHHLIYPSVARPDKIETGGPDLDFLVVASANYPNYNSLCWFLDEVWDLEINAIANIRIVGNVDYIFKSKKDRRYEKYGKIFEGRVANLSEWYHRSRTVLVPVTEGQGIAIKTLEALSYARPMLFMPLALRGFSDHPGVSKLDGLCRTALEFKSALRGRLYAWHPTETNDAALQLYEELFSPEVYRRNIQGVVFSN